MALEGLRGSVGIRIDPEWSPAIWAAAVDQITRQVNAQIAMSSTGAAGRMGAIAAGVGAAGALGAAAPGRGPTPSLYAVPTAIVSGRSEALEMLRAQRMQAPFVNLQTLGSSRPTLQHFNVLGDEVMTVDPSGRVVPFVRTGAPLMERFGDPKARIFKNIGGHDQLVGYSRGRIPAGLPGGGRFFSFADVEDNVAAEYTQGALRGRDSGGRFIALPPGDYADVYFPPRQLTARTGEPYATPRASASGEPYRTRQQMAWAAGDVYGTRQQMAWTVGGARLGQHRHSDPRRTGVPMGPIPLTPDEELFDRMAHRALMPAPVPVVSGGAASSRLNFPSGTDTVSRDPMIRGRIGTKFANFLAGDPEEVGWGMHIPHWMRHAGTGVLGSATFLPPVLRNVALGTGFSMLFGGAMGVMGLGVGAAVGAPAYSLYRQSRGGTQQGLQLPGDVRTGQGLDDLISEVHRAANALSQLLTPAAEALANVFGSVASGVAEFTEWMNRNQGRGREGLDWLLGSRAGGEAAKWARATVSAGGVFTGAWAGAKAGAMVGAGGGSLAGGVGAAPGAIIGGLAGTIVGGISGATAADWAFGDQDGPSQLGRYLQDPVDRWSAQYSQRMSRAFSGMPPTHPLAVQAVQGTRFSSGAEQAFIANLDLIREQNPARYREMLDRTSGALQSFLESTNQGHPYTYAELQFMHRQLVDYNIEQTGSRRSIPENRRQIEQHYAAMAESYRLQQLEQARWAEQRIRNQQRGMVVQDAAGRMLSVVGAATHGGFKTQAAATYETARQGYEDYLSSKYSSVPRYGPALDHQIQQELAQLARAAEMAESGLSGVAKAAAMTEQGLLANFFALQRQSQYPLGPEAGKGVVSYSAANQLATARSTYEAYLSEKYSAMPRYGPAAGSQAQSYLSRLESAAATEAESNRKIIARREADELLAVERQRIQVGRDLIRVMNDETQLRYQQVQHMAQERLDSMNELRNLNVAIHGLKDYAGIAAIPAGMPKNLEAHQQWTSVLGQISGLEDSTMSAIERMAQEHGQSIGQYISSFITRTTGFDIPKGGLQDIMQQWGSASAAESAEDLSFQMQTTALRQRNNDLISENNDLLKDLMSYLNLPSMTSSEWGDLSTAQKHMLGLD